ncbi:hypothetical protein TI03_00305 [Achromatium sp. WMS1]|nr:hypothetical protein TI03_00305 [Achromatium sp. WMS1]
MKKLVTLNISHDRRILKRINALIKAIERNPFDGIGNPEQLKHRWSGVWFLEQACRRIDDGHRLVCTYQNIIIAQGGYHY